MPPFNPFKLYANTTPLDEADPAEDGQQDAAVKIVELLGGMLPSEDGQELDAQEVAELVARAMAAGDQQTAASEAAARLGALSPGELLAERSSRTVPEPLPPNTSVLQKIVVRGDERRRPRGPRGALIKAQRGDTLVRILPRLGRRDLAGAGHDRCGRAALLPDGALQPGPGVHVTLVPSVVRANRMEPVRFSVFGEGQDHKVTVTRNAAGEFVASASRVDERIGRAELADDDQPQASSLYASLHHTAERQGIPPESILQILKIHAYETDFRQRVRAGDAFEFFFDVKDEDKGIEGSLGELLATSITASGETHKFYRFRTPDGVVDYYDEQGNTSRKFLMRRPVRGEDVRITSGFGVRRHPDPADPEDAHRRRLGLRARHADHGGRQRRHRGSRPQGRVRQLHPHPPRQRLQDRLRPHVSLRPRRERQASRCARARSSATSARPACRRGRTCTSRCWSTTATSTRCRSRCRASAS